MKKIVKRGCALFFILASILVTVGIVAAVRVIGPLFTEGANALILFNNTDEMRGSGGFTTAYMTITRRNGDFVIHMGNSFEIDIPPNETGAALVVPPPRPMRDYMGIDRWSFRDANWSPDYPTSAQAASQFYTQITKAQTPLYVITVNMTALRTLMLHLPHVTIESETIDAFPLYCYITRVNNLNPQCEEAPFIDVLTWLRAGWTDDASGAGGDKSFIGDKAQQLIGAIRGLPLFDQLGVIPAAHDMLIRGDILLYSSDPDLQSFFATRRWSGPFPFPDQGNTLLYSENNIGYNKTSSLLRRAFSYQVSFDQSSPEATLTITYQSGPPSLPTEPIDPRLSQCHTVDSVGALELGVPTYEDRMVGCAWIYGQIYPVAGSKLTAYDVPSIPADQFPFGLRGQTGRIDALQDGGVKGWGYVILIPYGETRIVSLTYTLPTSLFHRDDRINLPAIGDMNSLWRISIWDDSGRERLLEYNTMTRTFYDGGYGVTRP